MKIFVKAGRPSKEEKELAEKIEKIYFDAKESGNVELSAAVEEKGAIYNLDGLKKMLKSIESKTFSGKKTKVENNNIKSDNMAGKKENESAPDNTEKLHGDEVQFEETINMQTESPLQQPVIERKDEFETFKQEKGMGGGGVNGGGNEPPDDGGEAFEEPKDNGDSEGGGGDEGGDGGGGSIPDHTKNQSNAKLAKVAAEAYEKLLPILPRKIAKISDTKIEKMERYDELDTNVKLQMPSGEQPTIKEYLQYYNAQLDARLVVTPEMKKDFQSALKAMMDEKKVETTPTQAFIGTVVSHFALMGIDAAEQMAAMNRNLKFWKEVHEENKKNNSSAPHQQPVKKQTPPPSAEPPVEKTIPDKPNPPASGGASMPSGDGIQSENEEITINPESAQVK